MCVIYMHIYILELMKTEPVNLKEILEREKYSKKSRNLIMSSKKNEIIKKLTSKEKVEDTI